MQNTKSLITGPLIEDHQLKMVKNPVDGSWIIDFGGRVNQQGLQGVELEILFFKALKKELFFCICKDLVLDVQVQQLP